MAPRLFDLGTLGAKHPDREFFLAVQRLRVFVEGQSEAFFIRDVVAPEWNLHNMSVTSQMWTTGRKQSGHPAKGGGVTWDRFRRELEQSLKQDRSAYFSTMIDLYKLDRDFPEFDQASRQSDPIARATWLEGAISREFAAFRDRFIPYIQVHEFESLIFSDASILIHSFPGKHSQVKNLAAIDDLPEFIDGGDLTHPAQRILSEFPTYKKTLHGPAALKSIGLEKIRQRCLHFDSWIRKLTALASKEDTR